MNFIVSDYDKIVSLQGIKTYVQCVHMYFLKSNGKFKIILKF